MSSVLICDNDPAVRTSVINKLNELGFDAIECCDDKSALSLAQECLPDIAVLGTVISDNCGLSVARDIRQKLKIPVILLMSSCDPDTLNGARKIGITTILTKPFRGQDLLPAIEMGFVHAKEVDNLKEQVKYLESTIESQNIIYRAKKVLLKTEGISESDAFRKIQKLAMDKQQSMRHIAEAILNSDSELVKKKVAETNLLPERILTSNIYLLNFETGASLEKGFVDESPAGHRAFLAPPDAAHVVRPAAKRGQRLIFSSAEQRWYIRRRPEKQVVNES